MIVDFHTHTFPERIAARAVEKLSHTSHSVPFTDGTDGGLVLSMHENGIDRSVILSVATSPSQVRSINDGAAARAEERAGKGLIAFGAMHPDYEDWYGELARIRELGLPGIKLHPVYQGVDLDDIRMLRIYDRCAELGLPVILHAGFDIGYPGADRCSPAMSLHALKELRIGGSRGRGTAAASGGPSFYFILAHMGGWRQWEEVLRLAPELKEAGPVLLDTAFSGGDFRPLPDGHWKMEETHMLDPETFLAIIRAYGAERILFGTDSPWSQQGEALRFVKDLPLERGELEAILCGNAFRVLGRNADTLTEGIG